MPAVARMRYNAWREIQSSAAAAFVSGHAPRGAAICNQEEADRDTPKLPAVPARTVPVPGAAAGPCHAAARDLRGRDL